MLSYCFWYHQCTLDSLISVGLCLLISRIFSRVYDLIREVFSIAIGIKFKIFNFSSKLSVIQHYFCFFCKISRVYAYFSGQIFQRLCLFKGLCLLESLEYIHSPFQFQDRCLAPIAQNRRMPVHPWHPHRRTEGL